ncbi:MAG: YdjY domain-containing protein [Planctomycetota bacterium]
MAALLLPLLTAFLLLPAAQEPAAAPVPAQDETQDPAPDGLEALLASFAEQGIELDLAAGHMRLPVVVTQRYEPLEYLLCLQPQGKDFESLLSITDTTGEALNTALLLLGAEVGTIGRIRGVDPPPTVEEMQQGVMPYVFEPAYGGVGFHLYVEWESVLPDGRVEPYRFRAEDLVLNIRDERTYQRGSFVYLGSRFVKPHKDAKEIYVAHAEGNLISLVHFPTPDHLLIGTDPRCESQTIWYPNIYLLPPIGTPVTLVLERAAEAPGVAPTGG